MNEWVKVLAKPPTPPRVIAEPAGMRHGFGDAKPETLMVGKLVRAVSGLNAALHLAEIGYVTECGALLRIVGDICEEVSTVGWALRAVGEGKPMNVDVEAFVSNYFIP